MNYRNTAVVLGLYDTGVATARCLGRLGIRVEGYDHSAGMPGFKSRYCRSALCPHPATDPEGLLNFLRERSVGAVPRILYPASDEFVLFVSRNRAALRQHFAFLLPDQDLTGKMIDKSSQLRLIKELGIEVPVTQEAHSLESLLRISAGVRYPALIKAVHGYEWKKYYDRKGYRVEDEAGLIALCTDVFSHNIGIVIQEIIPGPCTNNYEVSVYVSPRGDIAGSLTVRKIRQYPADFGFGTMTVSTRNEEVESLSYKIIRGLNWRGFANIEFKYDPVARAYKFIELNARVWQQVGQAESLGMNFPLLYYLDLTAAPPMTYRGYACGLKWIDLKFDTVSSLKLIANKELSVLEWLKSLRKVRALGLFSFDDPLPFLHAIKYGAGVFKRGAFARCLSGRA